MTIAIKNDRDKIVAYIEIKDGHIVEDSLKGCFCSDIDGNGDGSAHYTLNLDCPVDTIENFSNQTLLDEIRFRMCE